LETLHEAGIKADALLVDAHLGYYLNRTIIDRLAADVFAPARHQGYRRIVVVGISLGGMGAVLCARSLPQSVDAMVLIAPYLGDRSSLFAEIKAAGGPAAWVKQGPSHRGEPDEEIWVSLGSHAADLPPTWLLVGTQDRLGEGQRLLAALLPPDHVTTIPGGHSWKVWRSLWRTACANPATFPERSRNAP
jgi:pimeloyl-ACP methyl ester carboxylesterase